MSVFYSVVFNLLFVRLMDLDYICQQNLTEVSILVTHIEYKVEVYVFVNLVILVKNVSVVKIFHLYKGI